MGADHRVPGEEVRTSVGEGNAESLAEIAGTRFGHVLKARERGQRTLMEDVPPREDPAGKPGSAEEIGRRVAIGYDQSGHRAAFGIAVMHLRCS